jgi:dihydrolipoamide dehydrogenase
MLAHTAYREAEVCCNHIINNKDRLDYQNIPSVIYTSPECAWVGLSEEQAINCGKEFTVKKLPMTYSGRFVAENSSAEGLCKIIIDNKTKTIIGTAILADGASELIVAISNLILMAASIDKINELIFPHPTVGEIVKDVLNI